MTLSTKFNEIKLINILTREIEIITKVLCCYLNLIYSFIYKKKILILTISSNSNDESMLYDNCYIKTL